MNDDVKKLMDKMKTNKKAEEKTEPVEEDVKKLEKVKASDEEIKKAVVDAPEELDDDEDEDNKVETSDPIPATEDNPDHTVEAEIGLLQNNGMFRRELILVLKELVDVHKVNTQALLDLKKIAGGDDGKKD